MAKKPQQNAGLKQDLLNAANHEIEERAMSGRMAAGMSEEQAIAAAASDSHTAQARKHLRDTLDAHFEKGKFDHLPADPHISEASVRQAAGAHYEAVRNGKLASGEVPAGALWDGIHTDPHGSSPKAALAGKLRDKTLHEAARFETGTLDHERLSALRARDEALRGAMAPEKLQHLHSLEHKVTRSSGKHFSELSPAQQKERLDYLTHSHAHDDFKSRVVSHHEGSEPGRAGKRQARKAAGAPAAITVEGHPPLSQHYDGTVTQFRGGNTHVIQEGWDHATITRRMNGLSGLVDGASAAAGHAAHETTARAHVKNALGWMQSAEAGTQHHAALSRLKPKHIDAVVKDYAARLHAGERFAADSAHLTDALVHQTGKPGLLRRLFPNVASGADAVAHGASRTASAAMHAPGAIMHGGGQAAGAIPGILATDVTPHLKAGVGTVASAGSKVASKSVGAAKFLGKGILVAGAATAGIALLSGLLANSRPPRRLDNAGADMGDDPMVFTGNPSVGLGAMAVPQMGQQAQAGNWASRVGGMEQQPELGMAPSR